MVYYIFAIQARPLKLKGWEKDRDYLAQSRTEQSKAPTEIVVTDSCTGNRAKITEQSKPPAGIVVADSRTGDRLRMNRIENWTAPAEIVWLTENWTAPAKIEDEQNRESNLQFMRDREMIDRSWLRVYARGGEKTVSFLRACASEGPRDERQLKREWLIKLNGNC